MHKYGKKWWTISLCVITLTALHTEEETAKITSNSEKKVIFKDEKTDEKDTDLSSNKETVRRLTVLDSLYGKNEKDYDFVAVLKTAINYIDRKDRVLNRTYYLLKKLQDELKVVKKDEKAGEKMLDQLKRITLSIEKEVSIPSLVARRGGLRTDTCNVLAVNKELKVIVLDAGYQNGVVLGGEWFVNDPDSKDLVRLDIVEVRRTLSAAIPKEGRIQAIKVGASVKRATKNTLESKENYGN